MVFLCFLGCNCLFGSRRVFDCVLRSLALCYVRACMHASRAIRARLRDGRTLSRGGVKTAQETLPPFLAADTHALSHCRVFLREETLLIYACVTTVASLTFSQNTRLEPSTVRLPAPRAPAVVRI